MFLGLLVFVLAVVLGIWFFKKVTLGNVTYKSGFISAHYQTSPSVWQLYLRTITSMYNLTKPSSLRKGVQVPRMEVSCVNANPPLDRLKLFKEVCGFPLDNEFVPPPFHLATSMPLVAEILSHRKFPVKPLASLIHVGQTIEQLRPIHRDQKISKRMVSLKFEETERGTELLWGIEIYSSPNMTEESLLARGVSTLIRPKRKKKEVKEEPSQGKPTITHKLSVPANQGRLYAPSTQDYNPWHVSQFGAKLFGFKHAIAQGYWSFSKSLALIAPGMPEFPLQLEVQWEKPLFLPSKMELRETRAAGQVLFEMWTDDGKHRHLVGSVKHVPSLKLQKFSDDK